MRENFTDLFADEDAHEAGCDDVEVTIEELAFPVDDPAFAMLAQQGRAHSRTATRTQFNMADPSEAGPSNPTKKRRK